MSDALAWKDVEPLLDRLLDLPPEKRAVALARLTSADAPLRRELETLLQSCERSAQFLEAPAVVDLAPLLAEPEPSPQGKVIGPYRIVHELGRGGMGQVYLAERVDGQFEQNVALKLIRGGLDSGDARERFRAERSILARLSHPNVARLLDGGMTADEQPWFAMEFVDGEPLFQFADRQQLDVPARVDLFKNVCDAVRYAHQHHVVHRDIKPSNILVTADGQVKLLDFGIAKLLGDPSNEAGITRTGLRVMTPEYAAPEQVRGEPVTPATDVYALGAVLYELLAGRPAHRFNRGTVSEIEKTICEVDPERPSMAAVGAGHPERRRVIAGDLDTIIQKALQKEPTRRYVSADELLEDVTRFQAGLPVSARPDSLTYRTHKFVRRYRVPVVAAVSVVLVAIAGLAAVLPMRSRLSRARAEALLPQIAELERRGAYLEAYRLAERAERVLGPNSELTRLMPLVADWLSIESDPPGAAVWLQRFPSLDSVRVGTTPLREFRVARADYRLAVRLPNYFPAERMASTAAARVQVLNSISSKATFSFRLVPEASVPDGMVPVAGGKYELVSFDVPRGIAAELEDFFIDRTEVTNAAYHEFVRLGGYTLDSLWPDVDRRRLVDRTGLAGPQDWSEQRYNEGQGNHPVTGVSWFEARAFCAWRGATLPTVFQWEKAARNGETNAVGTIMPWGLADQGMAQRANYSASGSMPVNAHPFGASPWGALDMAGNVKEWNLNALGAGRVVTGGSWEDRSYLYSEFGEFPAETRTGSLGFRCAATAGGTATDQGNAPLRLDMRTPDYHPVSDATFRTFLPFYRYDPPTPLGGRTIARVDTEHWIREKVVYRGIGRDSLLAYLYLPRKAEPPFQTLVYVGGGNVFQGDSLWQDAEWLLAPVVRAGRALLAPVLEGMTEREWPPQFIMPDPPTVGFRELMVRHSTELRIALDYLETRPEIDRNSFVYVGCSFGAGSRLVLAGTDDRWRSYVFIGAGIDERVQPTQPEASNINFAPQLRRPKLVINGRQDEEHPWFTRALPLWNLLREPKDLVLVEGAGHTPPASALIPAMLKWLDHTVGPVREK